MKISGEPSSRSVEGGHQLCSFCGEVSAVLLRSFEANSRPDVCSRCFEAGAFLTPPPPPPKLLPSSWRRNSGSRTSDEGATMKQQQQVEWKDMRVVRRTLCYVVGLPLDRFKTEEELNSRQYFGRYGKVLSLVVNRNPNFKSADKKKSCAIYVNYASEQEARRAILDIDGATFDGRRLKASYGTTKYCSSFVKGTLCLNKCCLYSHERGAEKDSFTIHELARAKEQSRALSCSALLADELGKLDDAQHPTAQTSSFGKPVPDSCDPLNTPIEALPRPASATLTQYKSYPPPRRLQKNANLQFNHNNNVPHNNNSLRRRVQSENVLNLITRAHSQVGGGEQFQSRAEIAESFSASSLEEDFFRTWPSGSTEASWSGRMSRAIANTNSSNKVVDVVPDRFPPTDYGARFFSNTLPEEVDDISYPPSSGLSLKLGWDLQEAVNKTFTPSKLMQKYCSSTAGITTADIIARLSS